MPKFYAKFNGAAVQLLQSLHIILNETNLECIPTNLCVFFFLFVPNQTHITPQISHAFFLALSLSISLFLQFFVPHAKCIYIFRPPFIMGPSYEIYTIYLPPSCYKQTLANALSAFKRRFRKLTTKRRIRKAHKQNAYIVYTTVYIVLFFSLSLCI